jgi:hypothetical protein
LSFIRLAEHSVGAHQSHPAIKIRAIFLQTSRQTLDHSADHGGSLLSIRRRPHLRCAQARRRDSFALDAVERRAHVTCHAPRKELPQQARQILAASSRLPSCSAATPK